MLTSIIKSLTSSAALTWLIAWLHKHPGPSSMTFILFVMYSVVGSSAGWKPTVAVDLNLLLDLIHLASSILSVKLTSSMSCGSWVSWMSGIAERAAKSDDWWDVSVPPAVHLFDGITSKSAIVCCVFITSDSSGAVRSRVLLPMWANNFSVCIEENVIDNPGEISLELTTMWATHRATT